MSSSHCRLLAFVLRIGLANDPLLDMSPLGVENEIVQSWARCMFAGDYHDPIGDLTAELMQTFETASFADPRFVNHCEAGSKDDGYAYAYANILPRWLSIPWWQRCSCYTREDKPLLRKLRKKKIVREVPTAEQTWGSNLLYNPHVPGDCFYEALAVAAWKQASGKAMRRMLAKHWRAAANQSLLRSVAEDEKMSGKAYASAVAHRLWGGRAEARLAARVFAEVAPVVIWCWDPNGALIYREGGLSGMIDVHLGLHGEHYVLLKGAPYGDTGRTSIYCIGCVAHGCRAGGSRSRSRLRMTSRRRSADDRQAAFLRLRSRVRSRVAQREADCPPLESRKGLQPREDRARSRVAQRQADRPPLERRKRLQPREDPVIDNAPPPRPAASASEIQPLGRTLPPLPRRRPARLQQAEPCEVQPARQSEEDRDRTDVKVRRRRRVVAAKSKRKSKPGGAQSRDEVEKQNEKSQRSVSHVQQGPSSSSTTPWAEAVQVQLQQDPSSSSTSKMSIMEAALEVTKMPVIRDLPRSLGPDERGPSPKSWWPKPTVPQPATASAAAEQETASTKQQQKKKKKKKKKKKSKQPAQDDQPQVDEPPEAQLKAWSNTWLTTEFWNVGGHKGQDIWCSLCNRWADGQHLLSARHVSRVKSNGPKPKSKKGADARKIQQDMVDSGGLLTPETFTSVSSRAEQLGDSPPLFGFPDEFARPAEPSTAAGSQGR